MTNTSNPKTMEDGVDTYVPDPMVDTAELRRITDEDPSLPEAPVSPAPVNTLRPVRPVVCLTCRSTTECMCPESVEARRVAAELADARERAEAAEVRAAQLATATEVAEVLRERLAEAETLVEGLRPEAEAAVGLRAELAERTVRERELVRAVAEAKAAKKPGAGAMQQGITHESRAFYGVVLALALIGQLTAARRWVDPVAGDLGTMMPNVVAWIVTGVTVLLLIAFLELGAVGLLREAVRRFHADQPRRGWAMVVMSGVLAATAAGVTASGHWGPAGWQQGLAVVFAASSATGYIYWLLTSDLRESDEHKAMRQRAAEDAKARKDLAEVLYELDLEDHGTELAARVAGSHTPYGRVIDALAVSADPQARAQRVLDYLAERRAEVRKTRAQGPVGEPSGEPSKGSLVSRVVSFGKAHSEPSGEPRREPSKGSRVSPSVSPKRASREPSGEPVGEPSGEPSKGSLVSPRVSPEGAHGEPVARPVPTSVKGVPDTPARWIANQINKTGRRPSPAVLDERYGAKESTAKRWTKLVDEAMGEPVTTA